MHRLLFSTLVLAAAVGCATPRPPAAPTKAAVAPGAQQDSHVAAAAPDRSLATLDYVAEGFPASDRSWIPQDYARAAEALTKIAARDQMALPRRGSQRSGEVFARMTSTAGLDTVNDRSYPLAVRVQSVIASLSGLAGILKLYMAAHIASNGGLGAEVLDLECLLLGANRVFMGLVREKPVPEPGSAARVNYEEGLQTLRGGFAEMVQGALQSAGEPYSEADRTRFATCLAEELPLAIPHLTPQGQAEARQSAKRALEGEKSSNVRRELLRLDAALSSLP